MIFKMWALLFVMLITTAISVEDGAQDNNGGQEQLNELANRIDSLQSNIETSSQESQTAINRIETKTKEQIDSLSTQLSSLQQTATVLKGDTEKRMGELSGSIDKQREEFEQVTKTISVKMETVNTDLKAVESIVQKGSSTNNAPEIDLSQYVPIKDFNDLKSELSSLKSLLTELSSNQKTLNKDLTDFRDKHASTHEQSSNNLNNFETQLSTIRKDISTLKKNHENTESLLTKKVETSESDNDKLKQLEKLVTKQGAGIERFENEMDLFRQECTDLEDLVHSVKAMTIGSMIERSIETCKMLAKEGYEVGKTEGALLLEWAEHEAVLWIEFAVDNGAILLEKFRTEGVVVLGYLKDFLIEFGEFLFIKGSELVNNLKSYDYSWLTDKDNWILLYKWIEGVSTRCVLYSQEQIIPAIKTQSTELFETTQTFVVDFYQNRKNNAIYKEVSNVVLPLLTQIDAIPKEYHSLILDILMGVLALLAVLMAWALFLLFCEMICPRIPKVEDTTNRQNTTNTTNTTNTANTAHANPTGLANGAPPNRNANKGNTNDIKVNKNNNEPKRQKHKKQNKKGKQ